MALPSTVSRATLQLLAIALVAHLERVVNWSITITEGNLYLAVGTETYETSIQVKAGTL